MFWPLAPFAWSSLPWWLLIWRRKPPWAPGVDGNRHRILFEDLCAIVALIIGLLVYGTRTLPPMGWLPPSRPPFSTGADRPLWRYSCQAGHDHYLREP